MRGRTLAAIVAFSSFAIAVAAPVDAGAQSAACAASKLLVGDCFAVHGRLTSCTSVPNVRIWIVGTKRVLGVADAKGDVAGNEVLTGKLKREMFALPPCMKAAWGDYTVCPLTARRPGVMQKVCLAAAAKVVVKKW